MADVIGWAYVRANGELLLAAQAAITFGGESRETMMANGRPVGTKAEGAPARVEITGVFREDVDILALNGFKEGSILFQSNTGAAWTINQASRVGDPITLTAQDGTFDVTFEGLPAVVASG